MRNSQQLQAAIEKQEQIMRTSTSEQTRNYARERISYLRGELMLQREYERKRAEGRMEEIRKEHVGYAKNSRVAWSRWS